MRLTPNLASSKHDLLKLPVQSNNEDIEYRQRSNTEMKVLSTKKNSFRQK